MFSANFAVWGFGLKISELGFSKSSLKVEIFEHRPYAVNAGTVCKLSAIFPFVYPHSFHICTESALDVGGRIVTDEHALLVSDTEKLCRAVENTPVGLMLLYTVLVFFFLAYFTLYNRLQFHPPH